MCALALVPSIFLKTESNTVETIKTEDYLRSRSANNRRTTMSFKFDKTKQYGQYAEIVIGGWPMDPAAMYHIVGFSEMTEETVTLAKKWLQKYIDKYIPQGSRKDIKWVVHYPIEGDPLCENGTVGWFYTPAKPEQKPNK